MHKTQSKIQSMSTAEWHQYHQLLENRRLIDYFADEILRFAHSTLKPEDVFRRFSLNGDGQLDLKEFQLAVKRMDIVSFPASSSSEQQQAADSDATAWKRSKELFSVFCPSNHKKLAIDLFCRIMNEWSLHLLKSLATAILQPGQGQGQDDDGGRHKQVPMPTPYAIDNDCHSSGLIHHTTNTSGSGGGELGYANTEGEVIWRRIRDTVSEHLAKLQQIFFKMDITSSGCVSQDEFQLAMSHIGVFLTQREYEKLYDALPMELKNFQVCEGGLFTIRYADFLSAVEQTNPQAGNSSKYSLPGGSSASQTSSASPPMATNARLWDLLVLSLDRLESLIQQYEKAHQRFVSPETFREIVQRCGVTLSNPDYAAMRVRLLPFTDANGSVGLPALLNALKAHDRHAMASSMQSPMTETVPTTTTSILHGIPTVSPIRTGRKTVFPKANDRFQQPTTSANASPVLSGSLPSTGSSTSSVAPSHAAGKSNEQRNSEANRTIVKIRDDSRWHKNNDLHGPPVATTGGGISDLARPYADHDTDPNSFEDAATANNKLQPMAIEKRILHKLQQLKEIGQLASASPQSVFPGDRFNRITRGAFRQSLVHLSVLARYAEVESLFWTLDPNGRGYIVNQDLYDHLNEAAAAMPLSSPPENGFALPPLSTHDSSASSGKFLPRSVQKIFEGMLLSFPSLLAIFHRCDLHHTGLITHGDLTAAIQEIGVLASPQDVQTAITAITQRVELLGTTSCSSHVPVAAEPYHPNGIVYSKIEDRLKQLCSDLLSPKKRRQHLSTASVLLAPQEIQAIATSGGYEETPYDSYNMNIAAETDALWNCPRRKMNQDHRAMKSTIQITDRPLQYDEVGHLYPSKQQSDATAYPDTSHHQQQHQLQTRGRRLTIISILQDLLERRGELKSVMDLHRRADVHGQVNTSDLAEILMASRLSLHFSNSLPSGITAKDFVEVLYPPPSTDQKQSPQPLSVNFLDLLHRISDVLSEYTRVTPMSGSARTASGIYSNNAYPRESMRRMQDASSSPSSSTVRCMSYSPIQHDSPPLPSVKSPRGSRRPMSLFASDELSLQRKVLYESRLQELLTSDKGRQSAAILIRHAFKGVMAREMVVPVENGEFEAVCRASDLKYVCYRLGLDLDVGELHFIVASIDRNQSGYIASPQLLQFFTHLAMRATNGTSGSDGSRDPLTARSGSAY